MSGHSKWSKVKHQKATTDVAKAAAFTRASRAVTMAVVEGGGIPDPEFNFKLRLAVEKARAVNMPNDNIKRAIEKAKGGESGGIHQESYEGYGPAGIALYIETASDNTNRTVGFIKQALDHAGGSMGVPGSVAFQFDRLGLILLPKTMSADDALSLSLEAGAQDMVETDDGFELYTDPSQLAAVRGVIVGRKLEPETVEIIMRPKNPVELAADQRQKVEDLIDHLESLDDVQQVFSTLA
jgi:YebC/PmpR family DNA-binding regulatory protein